MNTQKIKTIEKIEYNGKTYKALPFEDGYQHIEPCWDCAFGGRCFIGTREAVIKGQTVQVRENGFTCHRPADFPSHCTAIQRKDQKNVYFVVAHKLDSEEIEEKKVVVTFVHAQERQARKEHTCAICGETIKAKTTYQDICCRTEKGVFDIRAHNHCHFVATALEARLIGDTKNPVYDTEDIRDYVKRFYPENARIQREKNFKKVIEKIYCDLNGVQEIKEQNEDISN